MMSGKAWQPALIVAVAALAAGCGGARPAQAPTPVLPRSVARDLATRSDRVAASLATGDRCAAAGQAASLQQAAHGAVDSGRVPVVFRPRLLAAVDSLAASLPACPPPSDEKGGDGGHDRGKHKGKHKHGKGGGG
jgi:hypothetical protein